MRRAFFGGFVVLAVLAAGCGGDDDESSADGADTEEEGSAAPAGRDAYVESLSTALVSMGIRQEDSQCTAEVYLDIIGLEALQTAAQPDEIQTGTKPPSALGVEFDDADRTAFYQGVNGCFDVRDYFFSTVSGGDQVVRDCLNAQIDDPTLEHIVVSGWLGPADPADTTVEQTMTSAYNTCVAGGTPQGTIP